uniref:Glucuronosyltransferase n=1 Tax=Steinernema glaseri TaxID=37863 RepID=A0A1I7Z1P7_9BILA
MLTLFYIIYVVWRRTSLCNGPNTMDALPFLFVDSVLHLVDLISVYRLRDVNCLLWSGTATIHEDNRPYLAQMKAQIKMLLICPGPVSPKNLSAILPLDFLWKLPIEYLFAPFVRESLISEVMTWHMTSNPRLKKVDMRLDQFSFVTTQTQDFMLYNVVRLEYDAFKEAVERWIQSRQPKSFAIVHLYGGSLRNDFIRIPSVEVYEGYEVSEANVLTHPHFNETIQLQMVVRVVEKQNLQRKMC